jgi:hypothetical protein
MKPRKHILITGLCVVFLGAWAPLGAQAQVIRCTDAATGKVTYTDTWLWDKSGRFQLDTLTEGQL